MRCGGDDRLQVDHVVPFAAGGTHELSNMQTLCTPCHRAKTTAEQRAGVFPRGGHPGPSRRTTSLRLTDGQYARVNALIAAGYGKGLNAVIGRLIDEHRLE